MESVPAWQTIVELGHKPLLLLSSYDKASGVALLQNEADATLRGVIWWDGSWEIDVLRGQIQWGRSALELLTWAVQHMVVRRFDALIHLLEIEVQATAN